MYLSEIRDLKQLAREVEVGQAGRVEARPPPKKKKKVEEPKEESTFERIKPKPKETRQEAVVPAVGRPKPKIIPKPIVIQEPQWEEPPAVLVIGVNPALTSTGLMPEVKPPDPWADLA